MVRYTTGTAIEIQPKLDSNPVIMNKKTGLKVIHSESDDPGQNRQDKQNMRIWSQNYGDVLEVNLLIYTPTGQ